jgi:hypothetical protein
MAVTRTGISAEGVLQIPIRAKERNRAPRSREELTVLIDRSVVEEALAAP